MCGRYRLTAKERYLAEHFGIDDDDIVDWVPRYNIAPTQQVVVIRQDRQEPKRTFSLMRWGLIPLLVARHFHWQSHHQRDVRNSIRKAGLPGSYAKAAVSGSRGRLL